MNCLIAQSGGPTVAINASLAGAIEQVRISRKYDKIYGLLNGITGVMEKRFVDLLQIFDTEEKIEQLKVSPSMYLGSCRFRLPDYSNERGIYEEIFAFYREMKIAAFFYIGGNDSMDTVAKLCEYAEVIHSDIRIIGIPKTIDNDLVHIDHTPGFGSAAKYIATSMLEIAHDTAIYNVKSVTIVEIMGRDAGWLTAASALARNSYSSAPHFIYLPEVAFDKEQFVRDMQNALEQNNNIIVAVSEGIRDRLGHYISADENGEDIFGHSQLNGAGKILEGLVKERLGVKVRSVEINVLQRCAAHLSSKTDIDESTELGKRAVVCAEINKTAIMVNLMRRTGKEYRVVYGDISVREVANKVKHIPLRLICASNNDVKEEMLDYLKPLVIGEMKIPYEEGLPKYEDVGHLIR